MKHGFVAVEDMLGVTGSTYVHNGQVNVGD